MAASKKTPSKKTAPSASSPTGSGKKTAAKKAGSAAAAKKAAKKATASRAGTASATKKTAAKKTAAKKAAARKETTRKTAAKKTAAKKTAAKKTAAKKAAASPKKAAGGTRRAAAGTSSPKKSAPAAKKSSASTGGKASLREREEMIRKRTRKETAGTSTPTNAPVFTLADVRDYLRQQKTSAEAAATPAKRAKAAKGATKKTARKAAETAATPEPPASPAPRKSQSFGAASVADLLGFDPTQKDETALKDRDEKDVPKKFLPYFRALLRLHEEVLEGLHRHSEETLRRSSKEDSGDLSSYGQHMADAGTESYERDFALSLVSSEQEALYEIDEALRRIHEGTYGICEITGKPISRERLRAVPFTRYSVEGQREVEKRQTRQVQRAGIQSSLDGEESPVLGDDDSGEE